MKEFLRIADWPPDHAHRAYKDGYHVEAIQVLHGWIECQARSLFMLVGNVYFRTSQSETWDQVDQMSYKDVVRALLAVGQLSQSEALDLLQINSMRNKMIHQIFKEPYSVEYNGILRSEYEQVFKRAIHWSDLMRQKNESIIEVTVE